MAGLVPPQCVCRRGTGPAALPIQRAFSQEASSVERQGGGETMGRTADLFSLGRQEVLLGTAPDSDGLRKKPGDEEGSRGFREALRSSVPGRAEPRPQDYWRLSTGGRRNTAQNNLQLAEAWTSIEAEALLGQCQEWALQSPPEGTRSLAWSLARSWGQGGAPGPQSRTCPGNCGLLLGEEMIQNGHEARVSPPALAFEW